MINGTKEVVLHSPEDEIFAHLTFFDDVLDLRRSEDAMPITLTPDQARSTAQWLINWANHVEPTQ